MGLSQLFPKRTKRTKRFFAIGLDCAAPELVFERWAADLPNLRQLAENGIWGELESSFPCITVPAWSCMLSGRDPGELGIYGFRNRADHTYDGNFIATGNYVRVKRVWDYLSEVGKESVIVGVPQTFPIRPLKGRMISGFLTPGIHSQFTYPAELKAQVLSIAPDYAVDVSDFRTDKKDELLERILTMTEDRFRVVDQLLREAEWDFFMVMEIGVDRIHHGFWSYQDPEHRRYQPGNRFENAIHDYYVEIDRWIGRWLRAIPDHTAVLVVSDHGAKRMDGGICLNEWLWREGYLAFEEEPAPDEIVRLDDLDIDWSKTTAWGAGGYYGRVFINVRGREPEGIVEPEDYENVRRELADRIRSIPDHEDRPIGTRVHTAEEMYRSVNGVPPDLMVYFGDLLWRSVGTLGYDGIHTFENDTGPDDCNHAPNGLFILHDPERSEGGEQAPGCPIDGRDAYHPRLFRTGYPRRSSRSKPRGTTRNSANCSDERMKEKGVMRLSTDFTAPMKRRFSSALLGTTIFFLAAPQTAFAAYVDPNTGGMLFQLLAAAFAALSGFILLFARRIRMGLARLMRYLRTRMGRQTSVEPVTDE